ncbi:MAG: hypothetical protein Q9162_003908 [Coniocarpon cinnabarinum]
MSSPTASVPAKQNYPYDNSKGGPVLNPKSPGVDPIPGIAQWIQPEAWDPLSTYGPEGPAFTTGWSGGQGSGKRRRDVEDASRVAPSSPHSSPDARDSELLEKRVPPGSGAGTWPGKPNPHATKWADWLSTGRPPVPGKQHGGTGKKKRADPVDILSFFKLPICILDMGCDIHNVPKGYMGAEGGDSLNMPKADSGKKGG